LALGLTVAGLAMGSAGPAVAASSDGHRPPCSEQQVWSNTYSQTVSDAGPRNYYRLGEQPGGGTIPNGTLAQDQKGNNHGTYRGNVVGGAEGALGCDPNNYAVAFDDNGLAPGFVRLGTLTSVGDFTIEGFAFLSEGQNGGTPNPNGNATLFGDYGSQRLLIRPDGVYGDVIIGGVKYIVEVRMRNGLLWHHWAFVRSGDTLTIYRNGTNVGSRSGVPTTTIPLRGDIGQQANGTYPFQGVLDEIALYTRALSASEVAAHYQASIPKQGPPDEAG
jgi:Concanavalin A-like lectin/glucanases superfamily